jgi:hypothetical protein
MKYTSFLPVNLLMTVSFIGLALFVFTNLRGKGRSPYESYKR